MQNKGYILLPEEIFTELADSSSKVYMVDHAPKGRGRERAESRLSVLRNLVRETVAYTLSPRECRRYCAIGEYLFSYGADLNEQVAKRAGFLRRMKMRFVNTMGRVREKVESVRKWVFDNPVVRYIKKTLLALALFFACMGEARQAALEAMAGFFGSLTLDNIVRLKDWIGENLVKGWDTVVYKAQDAYGFITALFSGGEEHERAMRRLTGLREDERREVFRHLRLRLIEKIRGERVETGDTRKNMARDNFVHAIDASVGESFLERGGIDRFDPTSYKAYLAAIMNEGAMRGFVGEMAADDESGYSGDYKSKNGLFAMSHFGTTEVPIYHKILGRDVDWTSDASVSEAFGNLYDHLRKRIAEATGTSSLDALLEKVERMEASGGDIPDGMDALFNVFNLSHDDEGDIKSLKRLLRSLKSRWCIQGDAPLPFDKKIPPPKTAIVSFSKLLYSIFEEEETPMGRLGRAIWDAFGRNRDVERLRKAVGAYPKSQPLDFNAAFAAEFSRKGTVKAPEAPREEPEEVGGGSISIVQREHASRPRGLDGAMAVTVASGEKRLAFAEAMRDITLELERRLTGGR